MSLVRILSEVYLLPQNLSLFLGDFLDSSMGRAYREFRFAS